MRLEIRLPLLSLLLLRIYSLWYVHVVIYVYNVYVYNVHVLTCIK